MSQPELILINGGRIIDPAQDMDRVADLLLEDGARSVIEEQVTNGVAVRMALLYSLITPARTDRS